MVLGSLIVMFLPLLLLGSPALAKPYSGSLQRQRFSCPRPYGYFKYTDTCDEYVECKYYVPIALTCPVGLHFNPRAEWAEYPCDLPTKVECDEHPTTISTTTTTTPEPTTTLPPPPPPPPTKPSPADIAPPDFWCPQPHGYFKYTDQCDEYVECKNYVPRTYSCPAGLDFNPDAQWTEYPCDHPSRVQCNREPEIPTTTTTTTTTAPPPPITAPTMIEPRDFSCPQPHGYFRQSDQCGEYIECKNYVPRTYACPAGLEFNPDAQWTQYPCDHPSRVQCNREPEIPPTTTTTTTTEPPPPITAPTVIEPRDFSCPQPHGYFRQSDQCGEYIECKNYVPRTYACPAGLDFNPDAQWTEYPCERSLNVQCDREPEPEPEIFTTTTTTTPPPPTTPAPVVAPHDFSCPQQHGYFKHTEQCGEYVECKDYTPRAFSCPADLHFNPDVEWTEYPCHQPSKAKCYK